MKNKIGWCDQTWNPIVGCSKISEGCKNCYAETMAKRLKRMGKPQYQGVINENGWTGRVSLVGNVLQNPPKGKGKRIFAGSMTDMFHGLVHFEWIDSIMDVINANQKNTFQILTKRPERMSEYFTGLKCPDNLWLGTTCENQECTDERIPHLLQTPAAVRFLSLEPLLSPIDFGKVYLDDCFCPQCKTFFAASDYVSDCCGAIVNYKGQVQYCTECKGKVEESYEIPKCPNCDNHGGGCHIQPDHSECFSRDLESVVLSKFNLVIVGCEQAPKKVRRPCKLEWIVDIVNQCKAADVPIWVKQVEVGGEIIKDFEKLPVEVRFRQMPEVSKHE